MNEIMDLSNVNLYDNNEVYRHGDCLNLKHSIGTHSAVYEIELTRLNTPVKVYQWLVHLLGKNWITRDMLSRMVRILELHFGYNLHDFDEAGPRE